MKKLLLAALVLAAPLHAQEGGQVASASGGVLRALDKISGDTTDLVIAKGDRLTLGNLQITMVDCRYPAGDPAANAYAALEITEEGSNSALFSGWMIASAPRCTRWSIFAMTSGSCAAARPEGCPTQAR
ncbi:DUF2155 domain-containing protein [Sulfitobacter faviae]|uniref:DUF2155 domain-containing protein n=1 Tax=Sulfitobacter faviae TaxID=1775881 RepID=UPI0031BA75DE